MTIAFPLISKAAAQLPYVTLEIHKLEAAIFESWLAKLVYIVYTEFLTEDRGTTYKTVQTELLLLLLLRN